MSNIAQITLFPIFNKFEKIEVNVGNAGFRITAHFQLARGYTTEASKDFGGDVLNIILDEIDKTEVGKEYFTASAKDLYSEIRDKLAKIGYGYVVNLNGGDREFTTIIYKNRERNIRGKLCSREIKIEIEKLRQEGYA